MDFGDTQGLRRLSGDLATNATQTDSLHGNINRSVSGLVGSVSTYERAAAEAFVSRWGDVGSVIRRLASDSGEISRSLANLADALDGAQREWDDARTEAWNAGFAVWESEWSASVTAPAGATDAQTSRAERLEHRMRTAAADAERSQEALRRVLGSVSDRGLAELQGRSTPTTYASTGDGGLDQELARVVAPMLAAHANLTERA